MVSSLIGDLTQKAEDLGVKKAKDEIAKTDKILDGGPKRTPTDIEKEEAVFKRGLNLATADGGPPKISSAPNAAGSGKTHASTHNQSKTIEFVHFGSVHRDAAKNFHNEELIDDLEKIELGKITGARGVLYRAAVQREAVLLGAMALGTQAALDAKDKAEGKTSDLLQVASDLLGGASTGVAQTAVGADLSPFLAKLTAAWDPLNAATVEYEALHTAGVKLHEIRVNLRKYVREQLESKRNGPGAAKKGLLSDLPFIGEVKIPGILGEIIGYMQKVTGKIHDVKDQMVFDLLLAMGPAMDSACQKVTLDAIKKRKSPIYPLWYPDPDKKAEAEAKAKEEKEKKKKAGDRSGDFANFDPGNVLAGDLGKIPGVGDANQKVKDGVNNYYNDPLNDVAEKPLEIIDFLKKEVRPAPGSAFLAEVFQVSKEPDKKPGPLAGGKALAEAAFESFGHAIGNSDKVPGFLEGFVKTVVVEVFHVCAEFLRAVYEKLCSLPHDALIKTDELTKAGSEHILLGLIDLVLQKTGLDELLKKLTLDIPRPPIVPPGVNWPTGTISAEPILAELKAVLTTKLSPYLKPVVEYAMAGLAERLNSQRAWAGLAMSMEVHIAQLPGEMAVLFLNLFGPLWSFLNDTLMGAINNAVGKIVGPIGEGVGLAKDGLGKVSGIIKDAEKKAAQAQDYAKKVEKKVGEFLDTLKNVKASLDPDESNYGNVGKAAKGLMGAAKDNPFKDDPKAQAAMSPAAAASSFQPGARIPKSKGAKIGKEMFDKVKPEWDDAIPQDAKPGKNDKTADKEKKK